MSDAKIFPLLDLCHYSQRALLDRKLRYRDGRGRSPLTFSQFGALSAAGAILYLYGADGSKRWLGDRKIKCDGPFHLEPGRGASVVVGDANGTPKNPKQHFSAEDINSRTQAPPDQREASKEGAKENETKTVFGGYGLTLPSIEWSTIGDKITDLMVPDWVKMLPGFMRKMQNEMAMAPGSLAEEIWDQANDPEWNPEILWDCSVRVSDELCKDEKIFLNNRKKHTIRALARYLDIPEGKIHPDDVPTIAMCGSGGGLRALVAGSASYLSSREAGLFDCITYTAGVSGSCWLQALFYSSITGQSHGNLIQHLKNRLGVHIAYPPAALAMINSAPTNKYLLSGIVEKLKGVPDADFGIVDIYGLLLAARLLVPKGELKVDSDDLKIGKQRNYIDDGQNPLPIYTAVRHEIPLAEQDEKTPEAAKEKAKREAWFQWFEFTPYEFWCEELQAGIPTWAVGRKFEKGRSIWRENGLALPELHIPLMLGIWGSAFCATLSHYYREIRPVMKTLVGFGGLDAMIAEKDEDLVKVHPIDPAAIPNFALGMKDQLPASCPESIFTASHLQLMDAGMSNNLPIYPLLRPGRDVDILIAFDASADVKTDNWLRVTDGYARQRGIKGWPLGTGWPTEDQTPKESAADLEAGQAETETEASERLAQAAKEDTKNQTSTAPKNIDKKELGFCNVWVGTTEERSTQHEPPISKLVEDDWQLMEPNAGITVIYFPFMKNPKIDDVDPMTSDFMSTWNFVYTPEQIDKVVALARANFDEGAAQTKRAVRAVYERKKTRRLERERVDRDRKRSNLLKSGKLGKWQKSGDHGDHFS
ncbi:FabD/lysophospholipase-like protein [Venturia nashicola]|uniref:Lysophospholipase n=1 Tax=Venturia nashicola TaxID=86259 RepID=A0A4Z1PBW8_9PEZI|nr:FabD/lysophospholipase-like protein [Venturia nashicola]